MKHIILILGVLFFSSSALADSEYEKCRNIWNSMASQSTALNIQAVQAGFSGVSIRVDVIEYRCWVRMIYQKNSEAPAIFDSARAKFRAKPGMCVEMNLSTAPRMMGIQVIYVDKHIQKYGQFQIESEECR